MSLYEYLKFDRAEWSFNVLSINSIFTRDYNKDVFFSGERHDFWELVYVERGKLTVAEDESVYELGEGQIIFHAPMEFHRFWSKKTENPKFRIISFSLDTNFENALGGGVFTLSPILQNQFVDTFTHILNNYHLAYSVGGDKGGDPVEKTLSVKKLESFLLSVLSDIRPTENLDFSLTAKRYRDVVRFMENVYFRSLSLDDIAKGTNMSVSYLKKLFMMYAGCGVMHYFTKLKVVNSLPYIRRGDSISEISEMLAFSSPNYFSTVFKREMGMLPTEYRNREKNKEK